MKILWLSMSVVGLAGLLVSSASSLSGCVMPSSTPDAGTANIPTPGTDSGTLGSSAVGTGCGTDTTTGVTLCTGTSACPGLTVDESVFPECGFYFSNGAAYLACLCSGYLCPIGQGQPTSCGAASSLLAAGNQGIACGEASNGGCDALSTGTSPTADSGGGSGSIDGGAISADVGSGSGGCDEGCESMCGGDPDCIQMCGC
jgi:hypothetical protein